MKATLFPRANLAGVNLSGTDLSGANLYGINLSDANLSGAILSGAILTDANLSGADLTDAVLTDADLSGADLTGADLSNTYLYKADFTDAVLTDANLYGADYTPSLKDAGRNPMTTKKNSALNDFRRCINANFPTQLDNARTAGPADDAEIWLAATVRLAHGPTLLFDAYRVRNDENQMQTADDLSNVFGIDTIVAKLIAAFNDGYPFETHQFGNAEYIVCALPMSE